MGFLLPISDANLHFVSEIRQQMFELFESGSVAHKYQQSYTPTPQDTIGGLVSGAFRFRPCVRGAVARW